MTGGRRMGPRYASELSRALLKGAFECAWLDHGEAMLRPEFDHVREAVLGSPHDGYLMLPNQGDPDLFEMELIYWLLAEEDSGAPWIFVGAKLYGICWALTQSTPNPRCARPSRWSPSTRSRRTTRLHESEGLSHRARWTRSRSI
jgi:hypothetical protein